MVKQTNIAVYVYIRPQMVGGKRPSYKKLNKKKIYPEGTKYSLGYTDPSSKKWRWETIEVLCESQALMAALKRAEELRQGTLPDAAKVPERRTIAASIPLWLERIRQTKAHSTYIAYGVAVNGFQKVCSKTYIDELTLRDLEIYEEAMIRKYCDETVHQRLVNLSVWINSENVMMEKNGRKVPLRLHHPFRQREVVSYTDEEFNVLCDASPQEEKDIWHLLRVSGLRKGELAQTIYSDINARESSIRVTVKPNNDWKPKSQKGHRAIPIPTFLLKLLQARHLRHPGGN